MERYLPGVDNDKPQADKRISRIFLKEKSDIQVCCDASR